MRLPPLELAFISYLALTSYKVRCLSPKITLEIYGMGKASLPLKLSPVKPCAPISGLRLATPCTADPSLPFDKRTLLFVLL